MKKLTLICLALLASFGFARADEGMWLPVLINQKILSMQQLGCRLQAEDIYSVNQACLKDAIVHFGGGCTGEIISKEGLLITNHHCGFGSIQAHSSVEHDYLKDGFWAMSKEEELPNPGLTVTFLRRMEDVTDQILRGIDNNTTEEDRIRIIKENEKTIIEAAVKGTGYTARITPMYYGNQYFLFVSEIFRDVRLVGAPPAAIGKFGGDTDNWMWPRHTGDFSIFRVYANEQNKPSEYNPQNRPYTPVKSFTISTRGVKEGDFTMVYGFPGRTQEYILSDAVEYVALYSNPAKIDLRTRRLDIMNSYMDASPAVRIQYASKNANVSNAWKKWQGEMKGIIDNSTIAQKQDFEKRLMEWASDKPQYSNLIPQLREVYKNWIPLSLYRDYYNESLLPMDIYQFIATISRILARADQMAEDAVKDRLKEAAAAFYKNYFQMLDKESYMAMYDAFNRLVPESMQPQNFPIADKNLCSTEAWVDYLYKNSAFVDPDKTKAWIEAGNWNESFEADPACISYMALSNKLNNDIVKPLTQLNLRLDLLYRSYMRAQMDFDTERVFFPDANSTLRVSYGQVKGYSPKDGVQYKEFSTIEGIMEKDNPDIYDYNIPQVLRDIYARKDYGRWEVDGTVPVAFIATNHTTGGNSGSPILNADGALLGLNFDRVWEGTMSDIAFDSRICRNISVDIRYVLFIIDRIGGAGYLFNEMEFDIF